MSVVCRWNSNRYLILTWSSTSFTEECCNFGLGWSTAQQPRRVTANGFRVNQCPTLALWTLITTLVNAKWLPPKTPYCQVLKQLASRVIYSLLNRQWSLLHISHIVGLGSSSLSPTLSSLANGWVLREIYSKYVSSLFFSLDNLAVIFVVLFWEQ